MMSGAARRLARFYAKEAQDPREREGGTDMARYKPQRTHGDDIQFSNESPMHEGASAPQPTPSHAVQASRPTMTGAASLTLKALGPFMTPSAPPAPPVKMTGVTPTRAPRLLLSDDSVMASGALPSPALTRYNFGQDNIGQGDLRNATVLSRLQQDFEDYEYCLRCTALENTACDFHITKPLPFSSCIGFYEKIGEPANKCMVCLPADGHEWGLRLSNYQKNMLSKAGRGDATSVEQFLRCENETSAYDYYITKSQRFTPCELLYWQKFEGGTYEGRQIPETKCHPADKTKKSGSQAVRTERVLDLHLPPERTMPQKHQPQEQVPMQALQLQPINRHEHGNRPQKPMRLIKQQLIPAIQENQVLGYTHLPMKAGVKRHADENMAYMTIPAPKTGFRGQSMASTGLYVDAQGRAQGSDFFQDMPTEPAATTIIKQEEESH